jgi:predicted esterase
MTQAISSHDSNLGPVLYEGYLPASKQFRLSAGLESTPVLHCHGLADPIVRHDWGTKTVNFLKEQVCVLIVLRWKYVCIY